MPEMPGDDVVPTPNGLINEWCGDCLHYTAHEPMYVVTHSEQLQQRLVVYFGQRLRCLECLDVSKDADRD